MTSRRAPLLLLGAFLFFVSLAGFLAPSGSARAASADIDVNDIVTDPSSPVLGNPKGKVTIIEFTDYRCPYCRVMQSRLDVLLRENKDIRLVIKEWPIFGEASVYAARVALAANWQGKYGAVHAALFALPRTMDKDAVREAAGKAGVDLIRLDKDLAARGPEIAAMLARNDVAARLFQLQGTPGFVIGHDVYFGALSLEQLRRYVKAAK